MANPPLPTSVPHRSQFRKPQISIPKSTNHFVISVPRAGVKVRSWSHFPAGSIRIRHRLQTGTDQLRTEYYSSSIILVLVLANIFFFLFTPLKLSKYPCTRLLVNWNIRIRHRLQTGTNQLRTEYYSSSSFSSSVSFHLLFSLHGNYLIILYVPVLWLIGI